MELTRRLVPLADYNRILDNLREAEAIAEAEGDRRRLGLVCSHMADYFRLTGHSEQAVACGERALTFATELDDFALQVLAHQRLGFACHAIGDYRRAVQLLMRNVSLLGGELSRLSFGAGSLPAALSRSYMVFSLIDLGEFAEARSVAEEAVRIADEADTAHSQVLAAHSLGLASLHQGDFDRTLPLFERTLYRCRVGHIPLGARLLASALGYAYILSGRVDDGVLLLEQAVRETEELEIFFRYALWLAWLGEAYLLAGRADDAGEIASRAVSHANTHKERGHQAYALRLVGEVAAHSRRPDIEQAEIAYHQAITIADTLGMRPLRAHCQLGLGELYRGVGQMQQAEVELVAARELFRSMEMTFWVSRAEARLGDV
jgi:tetratricopeptide (TPR) repeat protein